MFKYAGTTTGRVSMAMNDDEAIRIHDEYKDACKQYYAHDMDKDTFLFWLDMLRKRCVDEEYNHRVMLPATFRMIRDQIERVQEDG